VNSYGRSVNHIPPNCPLNSAVYLGRISLAPAIPSSNLSHSAPSESTNCHLKYSWLTLSAASPDWTFVGGLPAHTINS